MIEFITLINDKVNDFVWGVPAMVLILGVGLWLSCRTKFVQIRNFGTAMRSTIGRIFHREDAQAGAVTPFQAVCTALAATVGTGNIAGVAGAIALGGPGAVFWMWISALLGMCTKFAEVTLAVHFRERNVRGDWVGGPMYYIKNGLSKHWHFLGYLYAALGVLTVFGTGNATQVNTITAAIGTALDSFGLFLDVSIFGINLINLIIGVLIAAAVAVVLLGGVKRIGRFTEKLVPFMAVLYVILGIGVIALNIKSVPAVLESIFVGAFTPAGFTGGVVGSLFISMRRGVSRGIFSNEAGLGTGSIAHAASDIKSPVQQGYFGIFEVFCDTIVVCSLTAFTILLGAPAITYGATAGAELTISGFVNTYGSWVSVFTAVALCCFAFSTIIGWGLYGVRCLEFIVGSKANTVFMILYSLVAILGATVNLDLLWGIADTCNGLMAIPNLIALFLLSGTLVKLIRPSQTDKLN